MSEYKCIRCNKQLELNTVTRTLDGKDVCFEDYNTTARELCKGTFTSHEVHEVFEDYKEQLHTRNSQIRIMLQATLLSKRSVGFMINAFNTKFRSIMKEMYNKVEADLYPKEKTNLVSLVFSEYKELFGDYSLKECDKVVTREVKGRYYEWLETLNSDLDTKVVEGAF